MYILFILSFINFAMASGQCGLFEFQGVPYLEEDRIILKIHEKSDSEIVVHIRPSDITSLAPYLGLPVKGEVQIDTLMGPREIGAKTFAKLDYGIPDPLNPLLDSYLKLLKEEKCP